MHEMSIALEVCRMAEEQVGTAALADVVTVAVEVGDDAGVDAANLEFCLDALLHTPPFGRGSAVMLPRTGDVLRLSYLEVDDGGPDD